MARPKNVTPTVYHKIGLPQDLSDRLGEQLYSPLEGRIPHGALQEFFVSLVKEHFNRQEASGAQQLAELES